MTQDVIAIHVDGAVAAPEEKAAVIRDNDSIVLVVGALSGVAGADSDCVPTTRGAQRTRRGKRGGARKSKAVSISASSMHDVDVIGAVLTETTVPVVSRKRGRNEDEKATAEQRAAVVPVVGPSSTAAPHTLEQKTEPPDEYVPIAADANGSFPKPGVGDALRVVYLELSDAGSPQYSQPVCGTVVRVSASTPLSVQLALRGGSCCTLEWSDVVEVGYLRSVASSAPG